MGKESSRREWLATLAMGTGLLVSYGVFALQGLLFLLPRQVASPRRKLFAGRISQLESGGARKVFDLEGNEVLLRKAAGSGFKAFSSTCPHLGCKVHWQEERQRYLCPCHNGVFDAEGVAISGPPADAGQNLIPLALEVDEEAGVIYIQVREIQT